jgi:hypothetical protein
MSEQELRDYVKAWTGTFKQYGGTCHVGKGYDAQIITLDADTVAVRIMRYTDDGSGMRFPRPTEVAKAWTIASYQVATELLQWADAGGN